MFQNLWYNTLQYDMIIMTYNIFFLNWHKIWNRDFWFRMISISWGELFNGLVIKNKSPWSLQEDSNASLVWQKGGRQDFIADLLTLRRIFIQSPATMITGHKRGLSRPSYWGMTIAWTHPPCRHMYGVQILTMVYWHQVLCLFLYIWTSVKYCWEVWCKSVID